jgi:hypothetical protein
VKSSAVEEARKHVEAAKLALDVLTATSVENLWLRDLEQFEKSWVALQATREAAASNTPLKKDVKRVLKVKG